MKPALIEDDAVSVPATRKGGTLARIAKGTVWVVIGGVLLVAHEVAWELNVPVLKTWWWALAAAVGGAAVVKIIVRWRS